LLTVCFSAYSHSSGNSTECETENIVDVSGKIIALKHKNLLKVYFVVLLPQFEVGKISNK
jgi:hypothetical protein